MHRDGAGDHLSIATRIDNLRGYCKHKERVNNKAANRWILGCSLLVFAFAPPLSLLGSKNCIITLLPS
jgi:hypothetical protein